MIAALLVLILLAILFPVATRFGLAVALGLFAIVVGGLSLYILLPMVSAGVASAAFVGVCLVACLAIGWKVEERSKPPR